MKREKYYIAAFKVLMFAMMVFAILLFCEIREMEVADARAIGAVYQAQESDWVNVWSKPTKTVTDRKKVYEYEGDALIRVYAVKNGFGKVRYGAKKKVGWVSMHDMEVVKPGWVRFGKKWKKVR